MKHVALTTATASTVSRLYESAPNYTMGEGERLITFRDLLRILRVHWRPILLFTAAAVGLTFVVTSLISSVYVGNALLIVDPQRNRVFNEQKDPAVRSSLPFDPASIKSQVQMLQAHALAGRVVDKLSLIDDPEFTGVKSGVVGSIADAIQSIGRLNLIRNHNQAEGVGLTSGPHKAPDSGHADLGTSQRLREAAIGNLLAHLDVHAVGLSTVIEVNFRSTSATKSADIANAVANTYIDNLVTQKDGASEGASKWLAERVAQLARRASAADAAVQQYKAQNGLVDTSNGTAITDQQLGALTTQLVQVEGDEAQARAKLARVQQLVHSGNGADATEVVTSPLIAELREQQATLAQQKADLSTHYGPLHPSMQKIDAKLRELDGKINEEVNRIIGTATNDLAVASARAGSIRNNMSAATSKTAAQNRERVKLVELQANAASERAVYQSYLDRLKQTQQQAGLQAADVTLVSPASVPLAPVSPKKFMIVGLSALASLLLGFLAALVADRMCVGFRSKGEVEATFGLPVLATIPELQTWRRSLKEVILQGLRHPHSNYSEAIRGLEIGLSFHASKKSKQASGAGRAILVTSALPGEGKTTTTISLARRLAASGHKVVVIDADLRRPALATALGLKMVRYSLSDYLTLGCSLEESLVADPHSTVMALPASFSDEATELVSSPAMASLVARLRQIADYVVIDLPPVLAVHDAKLLAQITDGTVLIVRWKKTPREAVAQALDMLREFRTRLVGAALTRADAKQHHYYAFGYGGAPALADYHQD